jgi:hypothetical protein
MRIPAFFAAAAAVLLADFRRGTIRVSPSRDSSVAGCLLHAVAHSARGESDEYFQGSDVRFQRGGVSKWRI